MKIVSIINRLCDGNGISLTKLEAATGLHNIYRWDEKVPAFDKVVKVADFFGVSLDSLVGREEPKRTRSEIESLYEAATEEDKAVIDLILKKYKKDNSRKVGA